jgi:putative DNA-invertase from lambdoid prophage Rac
MPVYGYCRVSTDRQADEGESLDVQRRKLDGYAMQHGWAIDRTFVERGVSGSKPLDERAEGQKLLSILSAGDVIITSKLDRMFRSALDALRVLDKLKGAGISLHMIDLGGDVTGDGISKLVFTILSAVAEAERERIRERVREVKRDQRDRARYLGGTVPFGWRKIAEAKGYRLEAVGDEQEAIARMVDLRRAGRSLRAIAAEMRADGHRVSHVTVRRAIEDAEIERRKVRVQADAIVSLS